MPSITAITVVLPLHSNPFRGASTRRLHAAAAQLRRPSPPPAGQRGAGPDSAARETPPHDQRLSRPPSPAHGTCCRRCTCPTPVGAAPCPEASEPAKEHRCRHPLLSPPPPPWPATTLPSPSRESRIQEPELQIRPQGHWIQPPRTGSSEPGQRRRRRQAWRKGRARENGIRRRPHAPAGHQPAPPTAAADAPAGLHAAHVGGEPPARCHLHHQIARRGGAPPPPSWEASSGGGVAGGGEGRGGY